MDSQKHLFNLNPEQHFLNCAYKSPLLKSAEAAAIEILKRNRNPADITIDDFFNDSEEVKLKFGKLVNAPKENIITAPSTSYGFSSVLNNLVPKQNGTAITIEDFFPSGYFSLQKWCQKHQNNLQVIPQFDANNKSSWSNRIIHHINSKTSLVMMPHTHWMNGHLFDLQQIGLKCQQVGAKLVIDGTQSVGALPIDVQKYKIDALICASYKWLFGPYSLVMAYLSETFNDGHPLEESWMNRINAKNFSSLTTYEQKYKPGAARYNVGESSSMVLMPILKEGLHQLLLWKPEAIQEYAKNLTIPLQKFLKNHDTEINPESAAHLFSLQIDKIKDQKLLLSALNENQIIVSVRGDSIRVSVNVFNEPRDINKLIETIETVIRKQSI